MARPALSIVNGNPELLAASCALVAVVAVVAGVGMDTLGKLATAEADTWQVVFLRWLYGMLLTLPLFLWHQGGRRAGLLQGSRRMHLLRGALSILGSYCLYYALGALPLSTALSIYFTEPLLTLLLASLVLGERVPPRCWLAAALGFVGVLLIARPWHDGGQLGSSLVALLGAACWAALSVITKHLGRSESTVSLMLWLAVLATLLSVPFAAQGWRPLEWSDHGLLLGVAALGSVYSFFWIVGLKLGPAAIMANMLYLALPLAYVVGWLVFDERPGSAVLAGSAVIVAAVYLATQRAVD
ncbi:MAG TPA: DMT family transporter [Candidatus Competibacteraceae bacterium]|nr:DMT family transporter [Candidatus Competibacteraceae bacterium]